MMQERGGRVTGAKSLQKLEQMKPVDEWNGEMVMVEWWKSQEHIFSSIMGFTWRPWLFQSLCICLYSLVDCKPVRGETLIMCSVLHCNS